MRCTILLVVLLGAGTATAKPEPKCKIYKGDQAACQAEATQKCSGFDRYDKTEACVADIAARYEQCDSPEMKKDKKEAGELYPVCSHGSFSETYAHHLESENAKRLAEWIERANKVDASVARLKQLDAKWAACEDTWHSSDDDCKGAAKEYAMSFAAEVDEMIDRQHFDKGYESIKADDDHAVAQIIASEAAKVAEKFLAINVKLPASYRHKVKELEALKADAAKLDDAYQKAIAGEVASRGCPSGQALKGVHLKTLNALIGKDAVKKRIIRQTESLNRWRDGLITKEGVPVIVCSQRVSEGKTTCDVAKFTVYREKAPDSPWTTWDVSVGGGWEINCKKMK